LTAHERRGQRRDLPFAGQLNNVGMSRLGISFGDDHPAEEHWRHIPLVMVVSDHRDGFAVAFGDDAGFGIMAWGVEGHPVTDLETLHLLLHARLLEVPQARNDLLIEL
jgi:hypothetical protein